jgi:HEXXH motif-containing protein
MPGVITASTSFDPLSLAEILVHEASHQYFYLLEQLGPVEDGTDTNLYFSPVRNTERPLRAILLAYHAFANMLLFYRAAGSSGAADARVCSSREKGIEKQVEGLRQTLRATPALTGYGRAIWEPLEARLGG